MQKIIDFHIHIFPDHVAVPAIDELARKSGIKPVIYTTLSNTLEYYRENGIFSGVNLPLATKPGQVGKINRFVAGLKEIFTFGAFYPADIDFENEAAFIKNSGLKGVKLHPEYMNFFPAEKKYDPMYRALDNAGLYVLFHSGKDIAFSGHHSAPRDFLEIKERFPGLKIILAHMGAWQMWEEAVNLLAGEDFFLDLSFTFGSAPRSLIEKMIYTHRSDRLLFASDLPWADPVMAINEINSMNLPARLLNAVFYKNAESILGAA